jgi:outer membrane lipoprotein-sorting protein
MTPVVTLGVLLAALAVPAGAGGGALDRFEATWASLHDYRMTVVAHEVLGNESADNELGFAFRKPSRARLDIRSGNKSGSTIVWEGGDRVTAYRRRMAFLKMHGGARDKDLTSLRGNGILLANLGDVAACFDEHRDRLRERPGPTVDGDATDAVALPYEGVTCSSDPPADRGVVTLDEIDISRRTNLVVLRERFAGDLVVERWEIKDWKVDAGLTDGDLR